MKSDNRGFVNVSFLFIAPNLISQANDQPMTTNQDVLRDQRSIVDDNESNNSIIKDTTRSDYLLDWINRVTADSITTWETKELLDHFSVDAVAQIRSSWVTSTVDWITNEIGKDSIPADILDTLYIEYVSHFRRIADAMILKKRCQDLEKAMTICRKVYIGALSGHGEPNCDEYALQRVLPIASSHPMESCSLVFELIRERPHVALSLLREGP